MLTDEAIEAGIQAKGLTAPRIMPSDIEANILGECYFTAEQGRAAAVCRQSGKTPERGSFSVPGRPRTLDLLTFCVLVLKNGFTVTGESACVSHENFDANLGRKIARANAIGKVWPLMGYALKERLHQEKPA